MGSADVAGVDVAALMAAHGFQDSVAWALTGTGISIAGAPAAGSGGQLVTVRTIWSKFGVSAGRWAESFRIPVELIVARSPRNRAATRRRCASSPTMPMTTRRPTRCRRD